MADVNLSIAELHNNELPASFPKVFEIQSRIWMSQNFVPSTCTYDWD